MRSLPPSLIVALAAVGCSPREPRPGAHRAIEIVDALHVDPAAPDAAEACPHEGTKLHDPCFLKDSERQAQRDRAVDRLRLSLIVTQRKCQTQRDLIARRIERDPAFADVLLDHVAKYLVPDADAVRIRVVRTDVRRGVQKALHVCFAEGNSPGDWVVKERFQSLISLVDEDLLAATGDLDRVQSIGADLDAFLDASESLRP